MRARAFALTHIYKLMSKKYENVFFEKNFTLTRIKTNVFPSAVNKYLQGATVQFVGFFKNRKKKTISKFTSLRSKYWFLPQQKFFQLFSGAQKIFSTLVHCFAQFFFYSKKRKKKQQFNFSGRLKKKKRLTQFTLFYS